MVAENEGSIPPNTALLEISAPNVYYRLIMSSTKEKSAKVRFIYDKYASKNTPAIGSLSERSKPRITSAVVVN